MRETECYRGKEQSEGPKWKYPRYPWWEFGSGTADFRWGSDFAGNLRESSRWVEEVKKGWSTKELTEIGSSHHDRCWCHVFAGVPRSRRFSFSKHQLHEWVYLDHPNVNRYFYRYNKVLLFYSYTLAQSLNCRAGEH